MDGVCGKCREKKIGYRFLVEKTCKGNLKDLEINGEDELNFIPHKKSWRARIGLFYFRIGPND